MKSLNEIDIDTEVKIKEINCKRKCKKKNSRFGND